MCRLFGFLSSVPSRAHRSLVLAENALESQADIHSDGWGIGWFSGNDAYLLRSHSPASGDLDFRRASERLRSRALVVHVRKATVGMPGPLNLHPFRVGAWLFAHNGTLFDFEAMRPRLERTIQPELLEGVLGSTDSELLLAYLCSALGRAGIASFGHGVVDEAAVALAVRDAVGQLYAWANELGTHPPLLNFLLTNGRVFVAQRAGLELYFSSQKVSCADVGTCLEPDKVCLRFMPALRDALTSVSDGEPVRKVNHMLVASEPIGDEDVWEEIPDGALLALGPAMRLRVYAAHPAWSSCPSPPAPRPRAVPGPRVRMFAAG